MQLRAPAPGQGSADRPRLLPSQDEDLREGHCGSECLVIRPTPPSAAGPCWHPQSGSRQPDLHPQPRDSPTEEPALPGRRLPGAVTRLELTPFAGLHRGRVPSHSPPPPPWDWHTARSRAMTLSKDCSPLPHLSPMSRVPAAELSLGCRDEAAISCPLAPAPWGCPNTGHTPVKGSPRTAWKAPVILYRWPCLLGEKQLLCLGTGGTDTEGWLSRLQSS